MVETSEQFNIKILTFDLQLLEASVFLNTLISDLKDKICAQSQIPIDRQRLLYKGKLLKNYQSLRELNVNRDSILFLVANLFPEVRTVEDDLINNQFADIALSSLENTQTIHISRGGRNRRREVTRIEKIESIQQNLTTINSLIQCMNKNYTENQAFDINKRKFIIGQWVDVKDTADHWLEAQVIDIAYTEEDGDQVLIHYNGWDERWDEWINISSARIQPLRTQTYQSLNSPTQSPFLQYPADCPGLRYSSSLKDLLPQTLKSIDFIQNLMDDFYTLSIILKHEQASERIGPLQNRINVMHLEEGKEWESEPISEATVGSEEEDYLSCEMDERYSERIRLENHAFGNNFEKLECNEQRFGLLTMQIPPLMDRIGRVLADTAAMINRGSRQNSEEINQERENSETESSSLSPMPSQAELFSREPGVDIHIHAIFLAGSNDRHASE